MSAAQETTLQPKGFPPSVGVAKILSDKGKFLLEVKAQTITSCMETTFKVIEGKKVQETKTAYN